ncbi:lipopolysaccharide biosynthesis protein [Rhodococcus gordoniae]|uniref:lipopolysaccharide biosynthesis protein n=1 Tax=Rhodococcus gordoniae TaxID=223392 RepID=UPI0035269A5A
MQSDTEAGQTKAPMGRVVAHGAAVTMLGQGVRLLIQVLGFVLLSRLLDPQIFGLLAMVMVVVGVGEVVRDAGLSTAVIQATHVSHPQRSNLFWINAAVGVILAGALVAGAGMISEFYDQPALREACLGLALIFVLNGLSTQYRASLQRDLKFKALALTDVLAMLAGLCCAVGAALLGWGLWALITQYLVQAATVLVMTLGFSRWIPGLPTRKSDMGGLLRFGWTYAGTQMINYLSRNVDSIVIGRRFGAEILGLYDRAYQLLTLPLNQINGPVTKVIFPVLSKMKDDRSSFDRLLLRGQSTLLQAVAFIFSFACAFAYPIVEIVLGKEWLGSAQLFQLLAISGVIQAAAFGTYWVFLAKALNRSNLIYTFSTKALLVISVLVGSQWGVTGVAAGYSLATLVSWPIGLYWIHKISPTPVAKMAITSVRVILAYAVSALVALFATTVLPPVPNIVELLVGGCFYLAAVTVLAVLYRSFRRDLQSVWHVRTLLARGETVSKEADHA